LSRFRNPERGAVFVVLAKRIKKKKGERRREREEGREKGRKACGNHMCPG